MDYRDAGKKVLSLYLKKENNINVIEKNIYNISSDDENMYKEILHEVVNDIGTKPLKTIVSDIKKKNVLWEHSEFNIIKKQIEEQDSFIEHPFEVEEGVLTCYNIMGNGKKCNSKRVIYYQLQVRSSDEPMTTFATCCACGCKWQYSG